MILNGYVLTTTANPLKLFQQIFIFTISDISELLSPQTLLKTMVVTNITKDIASNEVLQACVAKSVNFCELWLISQFGNFINFVNFAKKPKHAVYGFQMYMYLQTICGHYLN